MKEFEYKVVNSVLSGSFNNADAELHFNNLGKAGWELCGIHDDVCVYKRELPAKDGIS